MEFLSKEQQHGGLVVCLARSWMRFSVGAPCCCFQYFCIVLIVFGGEKGFCGAGYEVLCERVSECKRERNGAYAREFRSEWREIFEFSRMKRERIFLSLLTVWPHGFILDV